MHIILTFCYFLLLTVSITEDPKNNIMGGNCIHSSVPYQDTTKKNFVLKGVRRKCKKVYVLEPQIS